MRLPPYGKNLDQSKDTVWLWAGEKNRVHQSVRAFSKNSLAFYAPQDPTQYFWSVKNRDIALVHFFEPRNFWVKEIIFSLLEAGAREIAEISWPHCSAWFNPLHDIFFQFYGIETQIIINNYSRS